jgi:ADP-heptose:LPS heptosyltransferase
MMPRLSTIAASLRALGRTIASFDQALRLKPAYPRANLLHVLGSLEAAQSLDLIVTCDTSVAHLAGALGRPVFVMLKKIPDWRWLLDRDDSPWYPTMRLFRQRERGDWGDVMVRVGAAIEECPPALKLSARLRSYSSHPCRGFPAKRR